MIREPDSHAAISAIMSQIERAEKAEQQLAQIRSVSVAMPPMEWHNGANYCMALDVAQKLTEAKQTIAALRMDHAQKDKRIAEVTENCRLAYNKVAGLEQRIVELEGGK